MSTSRRNSSSRSDNLNQAYDDAEEIIHEGSMRPGNIARFKAIIDRKPNLTIYNYKVGHPNRWREPLLGIAISEYEEPFVKELLDKEGHRYKFRKFDFQGNGEKITGAQYAIRLRDMYTAENPGVISTVVPRLTAIIARLSGNNGGARVTRRRPRRR